METLFSVLNLYRRVHCKKKRSKVLREKYSHASGLMESGIAKGAKGKKGLIEQQMGRPW